MVVFPASMWAAIPILRVRSSGNLRSGEFGFAGAFFCSIVAVAIKLPAEMRKRSIRLRHLMRVLALLNGVALTGSGVFNFLRKRIGHGSAAATVCVLHDPAHGQRNLSPRRHFHRHLIGCATNTT